MEDFYYRKYKEQLERLENENSALQKRLREFSESLLIIESMKENLLNKNKTYQHVIQHYHSTFDTIFSETEKCLCRSKNETHI